MNIARLGAAMVALLALLSACGTNDATSAAPTTTQSTTTTIHTHDEAIEVGTANAPTLDLVMVEDPAGGWNLRLDTTNFVFAPENVSTEHVPGEGHAHLYVDGIKITRIYGQWHQLPTLQPGEHTIRVDLSANDHSPLSSDGVLISDTEILVVPGEDAVEPDIEIDVEIEDGSVVDGLQTIEVDLGSVVRLSVDADVADQVHVHGYEVFATVSPGQPALLTFTADIPGVFEVELEGRGQTIVELEVS